MERKNNSEERKNDSQSNQPNPYALDDLMEQQRVRLLRVMNLHSSNSPPSNTESKNPSLSQTFSPASFEESKRLAPNYSEEKYASSTSVKKEKSLKTGKNTKTNESDTPEKISKPGDQGSEAKSPKKITLEEKISRALLDIFKVSIKQPKRIKYLEGRVIFLNNLAESVEKREKKLLVFSDLGNIFEERLAIKVVNPDDFQKLENKFLYLYECFERIEKSIYTPALSSAEKIEIQEMILNHFNLYFTLPEIFNRENPDAPPTPPKSPTLIPESRKKLEPSMVDAEIKSYYALTGKNLKVLERDFCHVFTLSGAVNNTLFVQKILEIAIENGKLERYFHLLFRYIHHKNFENSLEASNETIRRIEIMRTLFQLSPIFQDLYVNIPEFLLNDDYKEKIGLMVEKNTLLGRLFLVFALPSMFSKNHFENVSIQDLNKAATINHVKSMSIRVNMVNDNITKLLQYLLKTNKSKVLDWFYFSINLNKDKMKMQSNTLKVASDGFMFNFLDVLLNLCAPFTSDSTKYLMKSDLVNCEYSVTEFMSENLTRMNYDFYVKNQYEKKEPQDFHFVTQLFFMTHHVLQMSFMKMSDLYERRIMREINKEKNTTQPHKLASIKLGFDVHLYEENFLQNLLNFGAFSAAYLLKLLSVNKGKDSKKKYMNINEFLDQFVLVEGNSEQLREFSVLPEYLIENLHQILAFYRKNPYGKGPFYRGKQRQLQLMIGLNCILMKADFFANPYLKGELIFIISSFIAPAKFGYSYDKTFEWVQSYSLFQKYLLEALLKIFTCVEKTGRHAQFYEKFEYRIETIITLEVLLEKQSLPYEKQFINMEKTNYELFLSFVSFFLNDLTFMTDNVLMLLKAIKKFEETQDFESPEQKEQQQKLYDQNVAICRGDTRKSNIFLESLSHITIRCQESFLTEAVIEKFVTSLNYILDNLINKAMSIDVQDTAKFFFSPKKWIQNLVEIYTNMMDSPNFPNFCEEIVKDQRSYSDQLFQEIYNLLVVKESIILSVVVVNKYKKLFSKIKSISKRIQKEEALFEDAPDEFLDPLITKIMDNPVQLPSSNVVVDYMTIKKHLLNDPTDPFNRNPLQLSKVIPCKELKLKIQKYKQKKLQTVNIDQE